ncbi:zinc finger and SCAN domain-containing protein 2-like [Arapaima gigas]
MLLKIHVTALKAGQMPRIEKCSQSCRKTHCPFCPPSLFKPWDTFSVKRHLNAHLKQAVRYREYVICKCNLECRAAGHFHCVTCTKTMVRKEDCLCICLCSSTGESGTPVTESVTFPPPPPEESPRETPLLEVKH